MADIFTPEKRSEVMSQIRSFGNQGTELKLVMLLKEAHITGWRRHVSVSVRKTGLKVRPDFVFRRQRVAVFVDGCFWHGCPRHGTRPQQNAAFWEAKITRNQARDRKVVRELRDAGWTVLRIWECGLTKKRVLRTLGQVRRAVSME